MKLALGVSAVIVWAWPEKAQPIGIDDSGNAVGLEGLAEVAEVVPCGVRCDEASSDVKAGMVVAGEQERLLVRPRPPLVDGAVVLPEFADGGAAEAAVDTLFLRRGGDPPR